MAHESTMYPMPLLVYWNKNYITLNHKYLRVTYDIFWQKL